MAFRDLIFHNFRRKLFALALATLIWLTIHFAGQKQPGGKTGRPPPQTNDLRIEG